MHKTTLSLETTQNREIINITPKIESWLRQISAKEGILLITVPHATAGLILNEDEPGLTKDILSVAKFLDFIGAQIGGFAHNRVDKNTAAHLGSALFGSQLSLPISGSKVQRGTWQEILFIELDGPRPERHISLLFLNQ